jgi:serpin B
MRRFRQSSSSSRLGYLFPLAATLIGCANGADVASRPSGTPSPPSVATVTPTAKPSATASSTAEAAAPLPAPPEAATFARASNAFGLELYGKVRERSGNLALSPASLSLALTMAWAGAQGDTAAEMQKVLHLEGTGEQVLGSAGKLGAFLQSPAQPVTVRLANRLFGEKSYGFEPRFLQQTQAAFGAGLEPVDFRTAAEPARQQINGWVASQTERRIQGLIPPKGVDPDTRLVLVNAVYFLGAWAERFDEKQTAPAPFHLTKSETKDVPFMSRIGHARIASADTVKVVELAYQGDTFAMTIVLPEAPDGLGAVERSLSADKLQQWTNALGEERVSLYLPKFELNPTDSLSLGDTLKSLGMPAAFSRDKADFTGIAKPADPADRLCIAKVFHKAFVKVEEKGTEAAGASAVVMARKGGAAASMPIELRIDRPFLFFIRERSSGTVLFMGRVVDPSAP